MQAASKTQQSTGLERWRAERAGELVPPAELRDLRRRYGWTVRQISVAFEALAGIALHTAGDAVLILDEDLQAKEATILTREQLIRLDRAGWALTVKGHQLLELLLAYGDSQRQWKRPRVTF